MGSRSRILGRQMAQSVMTEEEIDLVAGGGPYVGRFDCKDTMCDVGASPGMSGTFSPDDCASDL